jgi:predicted outer membrane repeat protein
MGSGKWFRRGGRRAKGGSQHASKAKRRSWLANAANRCALSFEALEDRIVLDTYLVTTLADLTDGNVTFGSLRWAINQSNASTTVDDEIVFADSLFGMGGTSIPRTIALNGGELSITDAVRILGPSARKLTVRQTTAESRVFNINIGSETFVDSVEISGMTISGGRIVGDGEGQKGGAVFNREALLMTEVVLQGNSASQGGGAVYTSHGSFTLSRSLVRNNSGFGQLDMGDGNGGGAILNGRPDGENQPSTLIIDSTLTGSRGGAVKNRNGTLEVFQSTITGNDYGIVSWGNPVPEEEGEDPPDPTVFTEIFSSIVWGNDEADVVQFGMTDDEEPGPLEPSITSQGFNIIGVLGPDTMLQGQMPSDKVGPTNDPLFISDLAGNPLLFDYGGSTDVFLLDPASPAIDMGGEARSFFEQRGRHFARVFNYNGTMTDTMDIGAAEMQFGTFVVDTLLDGSDNKFSQIYTLEFEAGIPLIVIGGYETQGCFSLREAIEFAIKNPGLDTIQFAEELNSLDVIEREDLNSSPAPTIILTFGQLLITEDLNIEGPENFILEIDAVGNDSNPNTQNGTGSRVFDISDGLSTKSTVNMSNLTLMGGDIISQGGAIRSTEDLNLVQMTFKNNNSTADGGALWLGQGAAATIDRSTFNNNRAANNGGAIFVVGGATMLVTSSTFSANLAGNRGGAIYNNNALLAVEYSTITLNNASSTRGSGIGVQGDSAAVDVKSTIISANVSNDVDFFGSTAAAAFASAGFNLVGRGTAITAFNDPTDKTNILNPMLEPLARTGGLVETHAPVYRPDEGLISPVIDMGQEVTGPPFPAGVPEFDQRGFGFTRAFDISGVGNSGLRLDIGAYELQASVFEVSTLDDENDGVITPGNLSLREAIALANRNPLFDVITFDSFITMLDSPTIFLGSGILAPGTPADIRITSSMRIEWHGSTFLNIDGSALDNPSATIFGSRMFTVDDGILNKKIDVEFSGGVGDGSIVFLNANAPQGGSAFYSRENLTFRDVIFHANSTIDLPEAPGVPVVDLTGLHGGSLYQDGTGQAVKPTMLLERVQITGSSTNDVNAQGGAIYVDGANLEIIDTTITGNSTTLANSHGAAVALKNSTFTSTLSSITGNIANGGSSDGGGIYSDSSVVTLIDTVLSGNDTNGANGQGGGIYGVNSQILLQDTVVSENDTHGSQAHGGGIYVTGASGNLTLLRTLLQENRTSGGGAHGGGLAVEGGSVVIDASSVRVNTVNGNSSHGGGLWNNGGALTVRDSTISQNQALHAQSRGGGVYSDTALTGSSLTLILNSTVSGNSAGQRGGGVYNADGRTEIRHSTITNNAVPTINSGSGVASFGNSATTRTTVQSSIIAGNVGVSGGTRTDVDAVDSNFNNTFQSLGFNLIGTGNALAAFGSNDLKGVTNPGLAPLADNGPASLFFPLGTHALLEGSPAINAGSASFNPNSFSPPLTKDQAGNNRVRQGRIDIGAFESNFAPALPADFDGDNDTDGSDFLTWQRNVGATNATKAQGDANGSGTVNGQDLAVWRSTFGPGGAVVAATSFSSLVASSAALTAAESTEPQTNSADLSLIGSLGNPGDTTTLTSGDMGEAYDESSLYQTATDETAPNLAWDAEDGFAALEDEPELDLLVADDAEDPAVEDAVFAAWGEELL